MDMKIESLPSYRIAYMRRTGVYGAENSRLMEQLKNWIEENNLWEEDTVILGIAQDNPSLIKAENCRYDVCLVLTDYTADKCRESTEVAFRVMSGGNYAIFKIRHTDEAITMAWNEIFHELARQGIIWDKSNPVLERYGQKLMAAHYCEICVPITDEVLVN